MTLPVFVALFIALLMLGVGGASTRAGWHEGWRKPSWNPPQWLFGPAWAVILGLAAWAGVLASDHVRDADKPLGVGLLFGVNIVLHMLWSPLFFIWRRPDWALIEIVFLWLSTLALVVTVIPISERAGLLLLPYLIWVTFAAALNLAIVRLNRPFGARN
jgi:tryptophan-rich sensory protein